MHGVRVFCFVAAMFTAIPCGAFFRGSEIEQVPVDRLLANLDIELKQQVDRFRRSEAVAETRRRIARAHALAYARERETIAVRVGTNDVFLLDEPRFLPLLNQDGVRGAGAGSVREPPGSSGIRKAAAASRAACSSSAPSASSSSGTTVTRRSRRSTTIATASSRTRSSTVSRSGPTPTATESAIPVRSGPSRRMASCRSRLRHRCTSAVSRSTRRVSGWLMARRVRPTIGSRDPRHRAATRPGPGVHRQGN